MATYVKRGVIRVATDVSMTTVLSNPSSQFRGALIDLLEQVAAGIIANDPTIIAAAEAQVTAALSSKLALTKCIHFASGRVVWDGPNGAAATHYVLRIDNRWRTAAFPFPTPSPTRPAISY